MAEMKLRSIRPKPGVTMDKLSNALTGMGTRSDPRSSMAYSARTLSQYEIAAAYRGSGLLKKIINIPALDMVREWREWKADDKQIALLANEEKRLKLRKKIREVEILRALGGGALIMGLPGDISQPAPASVGKQGLSYLIPVSRYQLHFSELQDDARMADYGEPVMFKMTTSAGQQDIHPSRVICFEGDMVPALSVSNMVDTFWGESRVAAVLDAVQDCDTARAAFAGLITKAKNTRIGIPNLSDLVSTSEGEAMFASRMATFALAETIYSATIYDSGDGETGEKIDDVSYNFAGMKDVMNAYGEWASAISDIPSTRLLGRAPEGMNSSGDSQQADWNKKIRAMQTLDLAPCLDKLDRYLIPSALGSSPEDIWYEFAPLDHPSQKESAERFKIQMEAIEKLQLSETIPHEAMAKGVQSLMVEEGYLPGMEGALNEMADDERYGLPDYSDPSRLMAGEASDAAPRSLYVSRKLTNAGEFLKWAKAQGFEKTLDADDLHVTIVYSKRPVDWMKMGQDWNDDKTGSMTVPEGGARLVEPLGDQGAIVLLFASSTLSWRHEDMKNNGAVSDYPDYQPHVTITYDPPEGFDASKVEPYRGKLEFGPEIFEEIIEDWQKGKA